MVQETCSTLWLRSLCRLSWFDVFVAEELGSSTRVSEEAWMAKYPPHCNCRSFYTSRDCTKDWIWGWKVLWHILVSWRHLLEHILSLVAERWNWWLHTLPSQSVKSQCVLVKVILVWSGLNHFTSLCMSRLARQSGAAGFFGHTAASTVCTYSPIWLILRQVQTVTSKSCFCFGKHIEQTEKLGILVT